MQNKSLSLLIISLTLLVISSLITSWNLQSKNIQIAVLNEQLSHLKEKNLLSDSIIHNHRKIIDSIENKIDTIYLTRQIIHTQTHEKERDIIRLPLDSQILLLSANLQKSYKNNHR